MRKAIYRGTEDEARALFSRARVVHLATTGDGNEPILRTLHGVLDARGTAIAFHGAPAGEKMAGMGRRAVVSAEEIVASIPSTFIDPERACPATTYYLSAQAHGVIEEVLDAEEKAAVLSALMSRFQPEGGYVPIGAGHPLYEKAVRGLMVARVRIERLACKVKLGQNRSVAERVRILERLWERGRPEDVRAIAVIGGRFPDLPAPSFLRAPAPPGIRLSLGFADEDLDEAAALLEGAYWLAGLTRAEIRSALARSSALVYARDAQARLVGFARAVSDGKVAWIYDVRVAEALRGGGVGMALMKLLLDHPAVRSARRVRLTTRDAMTFYRRLGFRELAEAPRPPWTLVEMVRSEGPAERRAAVAGPDDREEARSGLP